LSSESLERLTVNSDERLGPTQVSQCLGWAMSAKKKNHAQAKPHRT
jgi:hypothetical protein